MDQGPARHPRGRRRTRRGDRRRPDRRMRRARPIADDSSRHDVQRLAPCRAAGAYQRASSLLPDADARPSRRLRQGAHSLARFDGARLGPHDARGLAHRDPDGARRTDAVRMHDRGRPSQPLSPEPHERDRHRGGRGDEAWAAHDGHARIHGHFREGRGSAAGLDRPGFGDDPRGQRAGAQPLSRRQTRRDDPRRACALLAARGAEVGHAGIGRTRRALRLPAAHPSLPVARRGRL